MRWLLLLSAEEAMEMENDIGVDIGDNYMDTLQDDFRPEQELMAINENPPARSASPPHEHPTCPISPCPGK